jgi:putative transposase
MPEHVHLLLSEPEKDTLADALKSLKQGVSRRLLPQVRGPFKPGFGLGPSTCSGFRRAAQTPRDRLNLSGEQHFWQKRYYDFNIRNYPQFAEKLRYVHRNPVKAGLCERPEDWEWSSFRHYATGCEGRVEIESEWTARKRERAAGRLCPAIELPHSSQNRA